MKTILAIRIFEKQDMKQIRTKTAALWLSAVTLAVAMPACGPKGSGMAYETAAVERGTISNSVTATGTIEPITEVDVGTQVSGKITKLYADYNSIVRAGQLLAELDTVELRATLDSRTASLEAARVKYEYQQKNYNRIKGLFEKGMVSETDYEDAEYAYETARTDYDQAKSNLVQAETNLGYARIYSPIDGIVISREVEVGQTVASSFETPTLFTLAEDLRQMRVIADVDEADIGQVEEGQEVSFTVDAYPNDVFRGTVTQKRLQATEESSVVTYEVVISADNPDLKLIPGLTANVSIYTMQKPDVLIVPSKALRFTPALGQQTSASGPKRVWVSRGGQLTEVAVKTGVSDGIYTEITDGVAEGDSVAVGFRMVQMAGEDEASEEGGGEQSPFMPTPPGGGNKKK